MNWDYIAGFFDGDGTCGFFTRHTNKRTFIEMRNTNIDVIKEIQDFLGYGKFYTFKQASPLSKKTITQLSIIRYSAQVSFLSNIIDKLIVKKDKARKVLNWLLAHPIPERKSYRKKNGLYWCPLCKQYLPKSAFYPDTSSIHGICGWCKACHRKKHNEYYHKKHS